MKKIISIIMSIFMCFSFSACSKLLDYYIFDAPHRNFTQLKEKYGTKIFLSGDFFDEEVMKAIELEWLQKPENVQGERYYSLPYKVEYTCYFSSIEEAKDYIAYLFESFKEKNFFLGDTVGYERYTVMFEGTYEMVQLSENLDDFFGQNKTHYVFWGYYTTTEKQWVKKIEKYAMPKPKRLTVFIEKTENEDGLYQFVMAVETNFDPIYIREPNE